MTEATAHHTISTALKWQRLEWQGACAVCGVPSSWAPGPICVTYPGWLAICERCAVEHAPELATLLDVGRQTSAVALVAELGKLGRDEIRVLALVARRLAMGQERFGRFDLARDARNFHQEALEEIADGLVYVGAALVRHGGNGGGL